MSTGRSRDRSRARGNHPSAGDAISMLAPSERYIASSLAGTPVASWASRGSGAHAGTQGTGANQPSWSASSASFGSKPVVTTTATQQLVAGTTADFSYLHDGNGGSLLLVARTTLATGIRYLLDTQGGSTIATGALVYLDNANALHFLVGNGSGTPLDLSTTAVAQNVGFVLLVRFATAQTPDCDVRLNRASVASGNAGALTGGASATALLINGSAGASAGDVGDRVEIVTWSRYLSAADVTAVESYVLATYGV